MIHSNYIVHGKSLRYWLENIDEYAELTNLTTEPNEVCFHRHGRVFMQGFRLWDAHSITNHFVITETDLRDFLCQGSSLYTLSKMLKWRGHVLLGKRYSSLTEFKEGTVGEKFIEYLKRGVGVGAVDNEFEGKCVSVPNLEEDRGYDAAASHIVGITEVRFDRYVDTSAKGYQFDYAEVSVSLIGLSELPMSKRVELAKRYRKAIDEAAIACISKKSRFKRTGLSTNYLKCDNCTLTQDCRMVYKFSWKLEPTATI